MNNPREQFKFNIKSRLSGTLARRGEIITPHGTVQTPAFIVVNTYHLYLQPGDELVSQAGGLHKFMNWNGPMFTDSGGFQAFSLGVAMGRGINKVADADAKEDSSLVKTRGNQVAKITDDGVKFKSIIDGSAHFFSPERSIQIQHNLGADVMMAFDECTAPLAPYDYQVQALARTHAWAKRCLTEHQSLTKKEFESDGGHNYQALYGVIQGARYEGLRRESAKTLGDMEFDGYGIGGAFNKADIGTAVRWVCEELPDSKPRHLLGIGEVRDLFEGVENGVDTFDCVSPTREARHRRGRRPAVS